MRIIGIISCIGLLTLSGFAELRIWTGKNGQTIEAEYIRDASGKVWLKPAHGKNKVVPIEALCMEDQQYIQLKTLPKIEIHVDDDVDRGTVGSDIDNVKEEIRCTVKVTKTSKKPYPVEYEVHFFLMGFDIRDKQHILAEKISKKCKLDSSNANTFSFAGDHHHFEYDPDPAWGNRYEGYLVVVQTADGSVLATKGRDKYMANYRRFLEAKKVPCRFDKNFVPVGRRKNFY